jgi:hypothetical protein
VLSEGTVADPRQRAWLTVEFVLVFFGVVLVYVAVGGPPGGPLPPLVLLAVGAYLYLRRRPGFDRADLWRAGEVRSALRSILPLWSVAAVVGVVAVFLITPDHLFDLPRRQPLLWLAVLVFYPLVSVYPQELVFRAFVLERYRPVFGDGRLMAAASAVAFGFVHIIFGNLLAVVLSGVGGWLFARRYQRSRSLLATSVEHALYGQLIFTIGLGTYFYHGPAFATVH